MYKRILSISLTLLLIMSAMLFTACGGDDDEAAPSGGGSGQAAVQDDTDDPALKNEDDGAELVVVPHDEEDFVGKWSVTSEQAQFLFGNVDLSLKDDGTWTGNITEEDFHGKWKGDGSTVKIKDSEGLINWELFFVTDGSLMFKDLDDPDMTPLVLKKR